MDDDYADCDNLLIIMKLLKDIIKQVFWVGFTNLIGIIKISNILFKFILILLDINKKQL